MVTEDMWERAGRIALDIYRTTALFPAEDPSGITNRMRKTGLLFFATIDETRRDACDEMERTIRYRAAADLAVQIELQLQSIERNGFMTPTDHEKLMAEVAAMKRALADRCAAPADAAVFAPPAAEFKGDVV